MNIFKLFGEIVINAGEAQAQIKSVEDAAAKRGAAINKGFAKVGKAIAVAFAAAAVAATAAIVGLGKASVSEFMKIEDAAGQVYTLLPGLSEDAKDAMLDDVFEISKEFGFLPEKVLPALYQALSAGVPKDNVFEYLRAASKMAVGGSVELEVAVLSLAQVMNAYGADVNEVTNYSDLFFSMVKDGITTVGELSGHLFKIAPIAASVGVEFKDIAGWMAELTAQGTPTAEAATYIKGALNELSKEGMSAFNAFRDASGKTFPEFIRQGGTLTEAIKIMETHADTMGVSVKDLFGSIEGGTAVLMVSGDKFDSFSQKVDNAGNAAGNTAAAYEEMADKLRKKFDRLAAWWSGLKFKIGEKLQEPLEQFIAWLEANEERIEQGIMKVFDTIIGAFKWLIDNGALVKKVIIGIGMAIAALAVAKLVLLISTLGPVGLAIAAVGLAAGASTIAMAAFGKKVKEVSPYMKEMAAQTKKAEEAIEATGDALDEFRDRVDALKGSTFSDRILMTQEEMMEVTDFLLSIEDKIYELGSSLGSGVTDALVADLRRAWAAAVTTVPELAMDVMRESVDRILQVWAEKYPEFEAVAKQVGAGSAVALADEFLAGLRIFPIIVDENLLGPLKDAEADIRTTWGPRIALAIGDSTEAAAKELTVLEQELVDLEAALAGTEKGSYEYATALMDLQGYHEKLAAAVEYLEDRDIEVHAALVALIAATDQYAAEQGGLKTGILDSIQTLDDLKKTYEELKTAVTEFKAGTLEHAAALGGLQSQYDSLMNTVDFLQEHEVEVTEAIWKQITALEEQGVVTRLTAIEAGALAEAEDEKAEALARSTEEVEEARRAAEELYEAEHGLRDEVAKLTAEFDEVILGGQRQADILQRLQSIYDEVTGKIKLMGERGIVASDEMQALVVTLEAAGVQTKAMSDATDEAIPRLAQLREEYGEWNTQLATATKGSFEHREAVEGLRSIYTELADALKWAEENGYTLDEGMLTLMGDIKALGVVVEEMAMTWGEAFRQAVEDARTEAEKMVDQAQKISDAVTSVFQQWGDKLAAMRENNIENQKQHDETMDGLATDRETRQQEIADSHEQRLKDLQDQRDNDQISNEEYLTAKEQAEIDYVNAKGRAHVEHMNLLYEEEERYEQNKTTIKDVLREIGEAFMKEVRNRALAEAAWHLIQFTAKLILGPASWLTGTPAQHLAAMGVYGGMGTALALTGFEEGAKFDQPTLLPPHVVGEGRYSELYLPLSPPVLRDVGMGIVDSMVAPGTPSLALAGAGGIQLTVDMSGSEFNVREDADIEHIIDAAEDRLSRTLRDELDGKGLRR